MSNTADAVNVPAPAPGKPEPSEQDPHNRHPEWSAPQLENAFWRCVSAAKPRELETFLSEHRNHPKYAKVINQTCEEYDEDGGNALVYCIKEGRDKGATFGGKDFGACIDVLADNGVNVNSVDKHLKTPLSWAVTIKCPRYALKLMNKGADMKIVDHDEYNPFQLAIQRRQKDTVTAMLEADPKISSVKDGKGVPPLVMAVKSGNLEMARLLLEYEADVNLAEDRTNRTAVYHAIRNKHLDLLDLLLQYKPDLDTVDCDGRSILHLICENSDIRYFHKVTSLRPHFSQKIMEQTVDDNHTPLIEACKNGNAEQVKHLLEDGAKVGHTDSSGKTALHHCADNLETQCAEMLLDHDSSILEIKDDQGYTVLTLAVLVGNTNLMSVLLDRGANVHVRDNEGHLLSHWAAVCGQLKVLEILNQRTADMDSPDNHHAYPIHYAAQMNPSNSGHTDKAISEKVLKKFIDCGVALNVVDDAGREPLLWAACSGNAASCALLLKAGADVNTRDNDQLTALHCAASRGNDQCIEVLRKSGADVNLMDGNKCTPLFYAITLGNLKCTTALIAAKADVNHVDDRGRNPVHCAAIKGCIETIRLLEKEGANLWHQNKKGDYPVHEAALKGHIDVVKQLLRQKNDKEAVNVTNNMGKTLLHIAAATNNLPLCKLLINQDCKKNELMKHAGKEFTPYDIAVIKEYKEAAEYLKQRGAVGYADLKNIEKEQKTDKNIKKDPKKTPPKSPKKTNSPAHKKEVKKDDEGEDQKTQDVVEKKEKDQGEDSVRKEKGEDTVGKSEEKQETPEEKKTVVKEEKPLPKKPKADAVLEKEDAIRTSLVSLRSDDSPITPGPDAKPERFREGRQSVELNLDEDDMGTSQSKKEEGKYVSLERIDPKKEVPVTTTTETHPRTSTREGAHSSKVGFKGRYYEDSVYTSESNRSRSRHTERTVSKKPYLDSVKSSVKAYQTTRSSSRSIHQLKRAQIHTGPMHDIVMFSKMMDNYRRGLMGEEEEVDLRNYANWDGYLNEQLRFVSHLYSHESRSPREVQETAKEQHKRLEQEAITSKKDTDERCALLEIEEEYQRKRNQDMDKEIDNLASRTAEMFDGIKHVASENVASAKNRNLKLRDEMIRSREEKLMNTTDPKERDFLMRQRMEESILEAQERLEMERRERSKNWHRRKDEDMRRRLLQAYKPCFPNDVFSKKSVCVSGGRVKSASQMHIQGSPSPRPRKKTATPRPQTSKSDKSDHTTSNFSAAQFRLKDEKRQVQMTPYGLRRVRNQDRPTYAYPLPPVKNGNISYRAPFKSDTFMQELYQYTANWSRKFDGSIRPRTGLVFVEPHVYNDLIREEKEAKQQISSEVRQHLSNGHAAQNGDLDSELS